MEKIINTLINSSIQGVDTYTQHNSTWLIFTDTKQWVIELTKEKTLWYNYNFFKSLFAYASLDVVENQHYITKWVEDNIINGVRYTGSPDWDRDKVAKDTLENGVRETYLSENCLSKGIEHTIQNGVKETKKLYEDTVNWIDDTIQNGVKKTKSAVIKTDWSVDDTIQNGVKETNRVDVAKKFFDNKMDDTIENGVKETKYCSPGINEFFLESVIENGVRDTQSNPYENKSWIEGVIKNGVKYTFPNSETAVCEDVDNTIQNGVKQTKAMDGWVGTDHMISKVINDGVKITSPLQSREYTGDIDETIENGVKETFYDVYNHKHRAEGVIKNGVKKTEPMDNWVNTDRMLSNILENGVKETKPLPAQTGNRDWSEYYRGREDRTKPFNDYLNDTLEKGTKIN